MVRVNIPGAAAGGVLLVLLSGASLLLLDVRMSRTESRHFEFLTWNLFLAWIPLGVATALVIAHRAGAAGALLIPGLIAWLLFLPNAPYLVTDYVHLAPDTRVPLWFDYVLLGAFSASGLLLGFASVYLVQVVVSERLGAATGWALSVAVFGLSAVGIYIGRVLRYNSWDVIRERDEILALAVARLEDPLGNALLVATVVAFTALLVAGYLATYGAGLIVRNLLSSPVERGRSRTLR